MSALELTYNFSKAKAGEIVPDFCLLSSLLYESTYESQLWMLYDSNKQLIDCGDAYTHQVSARSTAIYYYVEKKLLTAYLMLYKPKL